MKAYYLVCYDIQDQQRLSRVFRHLKGRAFHLQYSVFLGRFTWAGLKELKASLKGFINERKDDIRIYPLPLRGRVVVMGMGARLPEGAEIYEEGLCLPGRQKNRHEPMEPLENKDKKKGGL